MGQYRKRIFGNFIESGKTIRVNAASVKILCSSRSFFVMVFFKDEVKASDKLPFEPFSSVSRDEGLKKK